MVLLLYPISSIMIEKMDKNAPGWKGQSGDSSGVGHSN